MRVTWVHPTWRDLVIERLSAEPALRRHFLGHCAVHGIVLALSVAGGASGQRRLPLVGGDEDWDTLGDRLYALAPELEVAELSELMTALATTIGALEPAPADSEARVLAGMLLTRVAHRWDRDHAVIPLAALDAWLTLSRCLEPPPALPSLAATWAELLPVRAPALDDVGEVHRFCDWLILCTLLADFAADELLALGYCSEQIALIVEFIDGVAADPETPCAEPAARGLETAALLCPEVSSRARQAVRALGQDALETWIGRPPADAETTWTDGFDVDRVLADL
ncbi:MAG TPA: hypothetical protein VG325_11665 [Solirubrobacteraceae bacterium]|nr:hypothetical protein [Solirubrobacteraceae bacterium]